MKDIPIEQMDERRLRVELSSAWTANRLLIEQHKCWGRDQVFHYCVKSIAPYPRLLCSVCSPAIPVDGSTDFNVYKKLKELIVENEKLVEKEQMLDALEAAGVDNWEGYDEVLIIFRGVSK